MPVMRGDFAEIIGPSAVARTIEGFREKPSVFARFMNVRTSNNAYEDDYLIDATLGPLAPKGELEPIILDEPFKLGGIRFIMKTFALGFLVSKEMIQDEKVGLVPALARSLGRSGRITAELYGHDVINNGFNTTKYVGRDGKALFATDHPVEGTGGVVANRPAVDTDLGEAALEAALMSFRRQKDRRGFPTQSTPRILLIPPTYEFIARRLLETAGRPGTNEWGSINVLRDQGLQVLISDWLTDDDAWFLLTTPGEHDLRFYWRQQLDTRTWDDNASGGVFHMADQRHAQGFGEWRGTYGSPGA